MKYNNSISLEEELIQSIRGYSGYKKTESREQTDKRLREHLASEIKKIEKSFFKISNRISKHGNINIADTINRLIDQLKNLIEENPNTNIHYTIIGKGIFKEKILKFIKNLGISEYVSFYQDLSKKELIEKYKRADVLVCLSGYEAFGISILEAIACNLPVLVSNSGGFLDFVVDDYNGFILKDFDELFEKMNFLLKNKLEFEQDLSLYDWNQTAERTLKIYQSLDDIGR